MNARSDRTLTCSRCGKRKALSRFPRSPRSRTGYSTHCLECDGTYRKSMERIGPGGTFLCRRCGLYKAREDFPKRKENYIGIGSFCMTCCNTALAAHRRNHIPVHRERVPIPAEDRDANIRAFWFQRSMRRMAGHNWIQPTNAHAAFWECLTQTATEPVPEHIQREYDLGVGMGRTKKGAADVA